MISPTRIVIQLAAILLVSAPLAACSLPSLPSGSGATSAPAQGAAQGELPAPTPTTLPAADAPTSESSPAAQRRGWNQVGQLVPGSPNGPTITTLAIAPTTPVTIYAGTLYTDDNHIGVWRSTDGGATWQPANTGLPETTGGTGVREVAVDPRRPSRIYAIGHFEGVWRSGDGGATWQAIGLTDRGVNALVIDPHTPDTLYALTSDGVQRSEDGGATWQTASTGLPEPTSVVFTSLVLDPQHPDTLYLSASFGGVFRSADGGRAWNAANTDLSDKPTVDGLFLEPAQPATLYLATTEGLYRSANGGQHWNKASDEEYLQVTPHGSGDLYAVLRRALYRSTDGGATWKAVDSMPCGVETLQRAPDPSGTLYAGCSDGSVYRLT